MLDGLTEELEEQQQPGSAAAAAAASFASLQFVSEQQMQQLNAQHLIGTPLVSRYLHGYFIARELYEQLKVSSSSSKSSKSSSSSRSSSSGSGSELLQLIHQLPLHMQL